MCLWANIVHFQITLLLSSSFIRLFNFLILSDLFHCFYRGNAWLIFKINVSLADKSDELNMKR